MEMGQQKQFSGEYHVRLDGEGRLYFPSGLRTFFDLYPVLAKERQGLVLYPGYLWDTLVEGALAKTTDLKHERRLRRAIYINGGKADLDRQGRLSIPKYLRSVFSSDNLVIIGSGDRIKILEEGRL